METKTTRFLLGLGRVILCMALFVVPWTWLPFLPERFELGKYIVWQALTATALFVWLLRIFILRSAEIRRTPLDVPLLIVLGAYLVSSLASEHRAQSLIGDFGLLGLSFVNVVLFVSFYFLLVQFFSSVTQVVRGLYAVVVSGVLASLYYLLYHTPLFQEALNFFSHSFSSALPTNPVYASHTLFGLFAAVIFILALGLLGIKRQQGGLDAFLLMALAATAVPLALIGFRVIWVVFAIGLFVLLIFFLSYLYELRSYWSSLAFSVLLLAILVIILGVPRFFRSEVAPEFPLAFQPSKDIAFATIRSSVKHFLLGSGPETYLYDFTRFRPAYLNNGPFWNLAFSQPMNTVFTWLTTGGVIIAMAWWLVLLVAFGVIGATWVRNVQAFRQRFPSPIIQRLARPSSTFSPLLFWTIAAGWIMIVATLLAYNMGAAHWLLFIAFTAFIVLLSLEFTGRSPAVSTLSFRAAPEFVPVVSFGFILVCTILVVGVIYLGRWYAAEIVYAQAMANSSDKKITLLRTAIMRHPYRAHYPAALSEAFLAQARAIAESNGDPEQVFQTVALALQSAKQATELAPLDAGAWKQLARIYTETRFLAPEAGSWAIASLEKARALDPANPQRELDLASAYLADKQAEEAEKHLRRSLELKPDFLPAYVNLALVYEGRQEVGRAIEALEQGLPYARREPAFLVQLARLHVNRGKPADQTAARQYLEQARYINPNYSDALFLLGIVYEGAGQEQEAQELFQKVLELNPGNEAVRKKLNS